MTIRVSQQAMTRQYKNNMSKTLSEQNKIYNKILTQRKFLRASENSVGAAKAISIRKHLANIETYTDNLKTASGLFNSAETSLKTISGVTSDVTTKILFGTNGDKSQDEMNIVATELENIGKDMLKELNSQYSDRRIFGGTNNSSTPFVYNESTGKISFNGTNINLDKNNIVTDTTVVPNKYYFGGKEITADQAAGPAYKLFEGTRPILIDVGIGIKYNADGTIDPSTAMDISLNGAELTGTGVDADGDSKNIVQLTFDAAKALRDGDKTKATNLVEKVKKAQSTLLIGITNLGVREQAIEYNQTRLDEEDYNLKAAQVDAEGMSQVELAAAMTEYKTVNSAYNAILQMGSEVVPTSIFDFIK